MKYYLQADIKKFYPSVNQDIMMLIFKRKFKDKRLNELVEKIVYSTPNGGLPIGSLLSQWLGNMYLNGLDHALKENLRLRYYYRYCDDLVIMAENKDVLHEALAFIKDYTRKLKLTIKNNVAIRPISKGIDFVGFVHYPKGKVKLRTSIKNKLRRKMMRIIKHVKRYGTLSHNQVSTVNSYWGWVRNSYAIGLYFQYMKLPLLYLELYDNKIGGKQIIFNKEMKT